MPDSPQSLYEERKAVVSLFPGMKIGMGEPPYGRVFRIDYHMNGREYYWAYIRGLSERAWKSAIRDLLKKARRYEKLGHAPS